MSNADRANALFTSHIDAIRRRTDRMFAGLLVAQWLAAIVLSFAVSPYAWEGLSRTTHPHVVTAIALGGLVSALPIALAFVAPGAFLTRCVIAAAQMLWSALLIHLSGGRIETHFHVFGSLAFLAFYRDWRVLVPATIVVAADHLLRQIFWPESVYGVANPESWRFLEHAGWVVFEDVFLVVSCVRGVSELRAIAQKRAELEEKSQAEAERSEQLDWALKAAVVARDSAERSNRVKSQFIANMSHELRTPINGMIGMSEVIERTPLSEQQSQYVRTIKRSGEALLHVVNDVLDFSKIEAGKLQIDDGDFALDEVTGGVIELLMPEARKKGLSLSCDITVDPALHTATRFRGDEARVRQVLTNLVGNAVKFTDRGSVAVRVRALPDTMLRFEVIDSGPGIAPEDHAKLFVPFSQVDTSYSRRHGGTGLGLSIAKHLTQLMGGEMGLSSTKGEGSTFWFTIPSRPADARASGSSGSSGSAGSAESRTTGAPQPPAPLATPRSTAASTTSTTAQPIAGAGARFLVAEDNEVNQQVIVEMLALLGHRAELVNDGHAAVAAFAAGAFDVVLMDCQMPSLSGYEAATAIRDGQPASARRVPIIALTAHAMDGDRERALAAGMDDYVAKPITIAKLQEVLQRWLPSRPVLDVATPRSKRVLELTLAQLPDVQAKLRAAAAQVSTNPKALRAEAHRFKGTCLMIGAAQLAARCAQIKDEPDQVGAWLADVDNELAQLRTAIEGELRAHGGG
jgi:two-component system, sensor histidine kinase and response regulator